MSEVSWLRGVEPLTYRGQIRMPYHWSVGEVGSRFLVSLRDEKQFIGNRCSRCNTTYVPPRKNCGPCFHDIDEWKELGDEGVVEAFTIVRYERGQQPATPPYAYAIIKLDGADVGLLHIIKSGLDRLKKGVRVKAGFREERVGSITDVDSFVIL